MNEIKQMFDLNKRLINFLGLNFCYLLAKKNKQLIVIGEMILYLYHLDFNAIQHTDY